MDSWISTSNPRKQIRLSMISAATGLFLASYFISFNSPDRNIMAGFLLGMLLLVIGAAGFMVCSRQQIVVDPNSRHITIEEINRFGTKKRTINFSDVIDVTIGYLGKKSNFVSWYYLVLKLKNGEEYPLFTPGRFFEGGSDISTVEGWRQRLKLYLNY